MDFLLDPFILAVPISCSGYVEADKYIEDLMSWTMEMKRKRHKFWLSYPIVEALDGSGQYPSIENFKKLAVSYDQREKAGLAQTMLRACEPDLMNPPYLDDVFKNGTVACDDKASVILPAEVEARLNASVAQALRDTLSDMAVAAQCHDNELAQRIAFASRLPHLPKCNLITFDGRVLDINTDQLDDLHAEWAIVLTPDELDKKESEMEYLQSHWMEIARTIQWMYHNWCKIGKINPAEFPLPNISVGKNFINSIRDNHYDKQAKILVDIFGNTILAITGITERTMSLSSHHPLYETDETDSPQRVRLKDNASAWRVHITRYKPAVRMHYWLLEDGSIELSKVGPHDDMTIK